MPWNAYQEAEEDGVEVFYMDFSRLASISMPGAIGINPARFATTNEETTAAIHELGHVNTGSFYNAYAAIKRRQKQENKADRYAIHRYIDKEELLQQMGHGVPSYAHLADYFGVTEEFIRKAVCLYVHGNLDVQHYCP